MKITVTQQQTVLSSQIRLTSEQAPALAVPWLVRLRYAVLVGEAVMILAAVFVAAIPLPLGWLALALGVLLVSNWLQPVISARLGARPGLGVTLLVDTLALTAMLALTGGPANPFSLLYLVQITLSAMVLSKRWTWSLGALSVAGYGVLFFFHVHVHALEGHAMAGQGFSVHLVGMWIAFVAAAVLISLLIGKVTEVLRAHEHEALSLERQLVRNEKIASIATLAAGAAHELGTPLGTIAIVARELERATTASELKEDAGLIRREVERCREIIERMSAEGAAAPGEAPRVVALGEFLGSVRASFGEGAVVLDLERAPQSARLPVEALRRALGALVKNALDAGPLKPVEIACVREATTLRFEVRDEGAGMSEGTLRHIAEPFFTTKTAGKGMGLGSFLVRVFAENLGGSLSYESAPGVGTTATLEIPFDED